MGHSFTHLLAVDSPESFFCVARCILQLYKLPTVSSLESFTEMEKYNIGHDSLLQDRCLPEFIFPISNLAMEPVAGDYCSCPNP